MNFQAAVTAIAYVYMVRGQRLSWLEKLANDIPVAVDAETGGAGDDIRLRLKTGEVVEAQVKKGLKSGGELWDSLSSLAQAINDGEIKYGVLVVSSTSSNTITDSLAKDIVRLGDGRSDNLSEIGMRWVDKLNALNLPVSACCKYIRIQTIHALESNQASLLATYAEIGHLCMGQEQIRAVWNTLYKDATTLIELRGRRDVSSILHLLLAEGITLAEQTQAAPILLLDKMVGWTHKNHESFSIFGVQKSLRTDEAWIPLRAVVRDKPEVVSNSLAEALENYQSWEDRAVSRDSEVVNPETLARFVTRTVVVAGPGMGKTTLLKRIARRYSESHIPVLCVRLSLVATRMRAGSSFEEAVFDLGLDGSGIITAEARNAAFPNWLLLCDGLDECGKLQEDVAAGVARFAEGYPDCRILVTTRPIGYETSHFSEWRHYHLVPLDTSSAPEHLASLVNAIAPEGLPLPASPDVFFASELTNEKTKNVVARSPLLLGLAASIIVRGGRLGGTREKLLGRIFGLIDDIPNFRVPEPPGPVVILQRYLDILGWSITMFPLSTVRETCERCAEQLAIDTESKLFKARGDAEIYMRYWLDVGMVERVGHGMEEVLAFIHKSFGEFAASRYLLSLPADKQRRETIALIIKPEAMEVIRYAGLQGLANLICSTLLTNASTDAASWRRMVFALELLAEATPPLERSLRERVITEGFEFASSAWRSQAFQVGRSLIEAARRFPDEIGPLAARYLTHKQVWTRLIAWASVVAAGSSYYQLGDLVEALNDDLHIKGTGENRSLNDGFSIFRGEGHDIAETFVLDSASEILRCPPSELAENIVLKILNDTGFGTWRFYRKAKELLKPGANINALDYTYQAGLPSQDYFTACRIADDAILESFDLPELEPSDDIRPCGLLHLSAFLRASKFGEIPVSDVWGWTSPFDKEAVREVIKGFIGVSGVDPEMLRNDAMRAVSYLRTVEGNGVNSLFGLTDEVDPPSTRWGLAHSLNLDVVKIEAALFHPSQWIVMLAVNLIEELLDSSELEPVVRRLLERGNRYTLWGAAVLSAQLKQTQAADQLLERLSRQNVAGCEYLYHALESHQLLWGAKLDAALRVGLFSCVEISTGAARLTNAVAKPGQVVLTGIIEDALAYWHKHEKPYPKKTGTVPASPRALLIEALFKIQEPSYTKIKALLSDQRSDVKEVGTKKLTDWLKREENSRIQFFNDVSTGAVPPHVLSRVLNAKIPLSTDEITEATLLVDSPDPKIRFNVMALLQESYLDEAEIRLLAQALTTDSELEIKDRAYRILDQLPPPEGG